MIYHKAACEPHVDHASCLSIIPESVRCAPQAVISVATLRLTFRSCHLKRFSNLVELAVPVINTILWSVFACVVDKYRCFGATCCLHFGVGCYQTIRHTSHTPYVIVTTVRTSQCHEAKLLF